MVMSSGLQIFNASGEIVFDQDYRVFCAMSDITPSGWYTFIPSNPFIWRCDISWIHPSRHFVAAAAFTVKTGFLQYYNAYATVASPPPSVSINIYRF